MPLYMHMTVLHTNIGLSATKHNMVFLCEPLTNRKMGFYIGFGRLFILFPQLILMWTI